MKIRINNIGARSSENSHRTLSFVKYYANMYYGKLKVHLDDGWEYVDDNTRIGKNNCFISVSAFDNEEMSMVIARITYDPDEICTDLKSVGERVLNLSKRDREDFFEVYELAARKLREACSDED